MDPTNTTAHLRAERASSSVDPVEGVIHGASLMTAGSQAKGWPMWIDELTLDTLLTALAAKGRCKAYLTHEGAKNDRTGEEIGFWEGFRKEGNRVVAEFRALSAWRKHEPDVYDRFFELAQTVSGDFGVSVVFSYTLAWVALDGAEVKTHQLGDGSFSPPAPDSAIHSFPSARVSGVISADFVDQPAANRGLLREKSALGAAPSVIKLISERFSSDAAKLARAVQIHVGSPALTIEAITAALDRETDAAELAQLRASRATADTQIAQLRTDLAKCETALDEMATLCAKNAERHAAALNQFRKGGCDHVEIGGGGEEAGGPGEARIEDLRGKLTALSGRNDVEAGEERGKIAMQISKLRAKFQA